MIAIRLLPLCVPLFVIACASSGPQPPKCPTLAASPCDSPVAGAAEVQGDARGRTDLKGELASVDEAITDLGRRIEAARDTVKAELQEQLAALQKRDDELKAQLDATGAAGDAETEKVRREIHNEILDLKGDLALLTGKIRR